MTSRPAACEPGGCGAVEPSAHPAHGRQEVGPVRDDDLRRRRRGRRADVRREVGEGDIRLVPDPGDDRQAVADDRAHDRLVVERPQVLQRPAAAGDDRDLRCLARSTGRDPAVAIALDLAQRGDEAGRRRLALDLGRHEDHAGQRPAARQHMTDVLPHGAGRAGHHGDRRRPRRQRALPALVEQPFSGKAGLERLEPQGQVAEPGRLDRIDVELERALRLEQVDPAVGDHAQPGLRLERRVEPVIAEPDALELVALVLEREVGVSGRRDGDPPDLPLDPQVGQARIASNRHPDRPRDLADSRGSAPRTSRAVRPAGEPWRRCPAAPGRGHPAP